MNLTPQGQQVVDNLAQRYGVSTDAVTTLLQSVLNGNGTMAQFSHPELGGSGQWMQGGMTMVGDMFNNNLKYLVDNLCSELSQQLSAQQLILPAAKAPSYSGQYQGQGMGIGGNSFAMNTQQWWPADLGSPSASGSQNNLRYAYFSNQRRLALDVNGQVSVYDTKDHQIGGFSQQQGSGASILLSSQYGTVDVLNLPLISGPGTLQADYTANTTAPSTSNNANHGYSNANKGTESESDIFAKIERLSDLKQKGILSEDEFNAKKAELLNRI